MTVRQTWLVSIDPERGLNHRRSVAETGEPGLNARFGRAVALRRVRAGLTQDQLASSIGLSRASIANIEQGRQQVLLHHAVGIARALGADLGDLVAEPEAGAGRKAWLPPDLEEGLGDWARVVLRSTGP